VSHGNTVVTDEAERDQLPTLDRPSPLHDLAGKRWVTQFRIVRLIGCGGMGEVWAAASDDLPGHMLAVKVVSPEHAHRREVLERFFAEARAASALHDLNVVKIDSTGRLDDGRPVLIMEHIDGPSIQSIVEEQGPLPLDTICQLMIQAASALRAAHAKDIIHRDIKPSNLLVCRRLGRAAHLVVVDFGIAKLGDPQLAGNVRTHTQMFMGTPGFLAPEQAHGRAIDTKVDTYALGVVLYYVLTGRLPYQGDSVLETLTLQAKGAPFPAPIELRPDTPPQWNALVRACVQLEPARRPTAIEFACQMAAGVPNGETLLKALAPAIAVHRRPSAVSAATLSSDVPTALSQLSAQDGVPRARARAVTLGLVAGFFVGSLVTFVAHRLISPAERIAAGESATAPSAQLRGSAASRVDAGELAVQRGVTIDAAVADAAVADAAVASAAPASGDAAPNPDRVVQSGSAAVGEATNRSPGIASSTPRMVTPRMVTPRMVTPRVVTPRMEVTAPPRQPGTLVITATPFAEVAVDGQYRGTTPLSLDLSPRLYRVTLTGPTGEVKTQNVEVISTRETKISHKWNQQ
jgi:Protein kinase domain